MTYKIAGLPKAQFTPLFALDDAELATHQALRVRAQGAGYPCRVSLEEAEAGESLLLINHVSHDVAGPFRTSYAIYVRECAQTPPAFIDAVPPMLDKRTLGLRGFDGQGMLRGAVLAMPGEADARIRALFEAPEIASIHAHNAAHGCFIARVDRS